MTLDNNFEEKKDNKVATFDEPIELEDKFDKEEETAEEQEEIEQEVEESADEEEAETQEDEVQEQAGEYDEESQAKRKDTSLNQFEDIIVDDIDENVKEPSTSSDFGTNTPQNIDDIPQEALDDLNKLFE